MIRTSSHGNNIFLYYLVTLCAWGFTQINFWSHYQGLGFNIIINLIFVGLRHQILLFIYLFSFKFFLRCDGRLLHGPAELCWELISRKAILQPILQYLQPRVDELSWFFVEQQSKFSGVFQSIHSATITWISTTINRW